MVGSLSAGLSAPLAGTCGEYDPFALLGPPAYPPTNGPSPGLKSSLGSASFGRDPDDAPGSLRDGRTGPGLAPGGASNEEEELLLLCELLCASANEAASLKLMLEDLRALRGAPSVRSVRLYGGAGDAAR